jgi:hypothetical protein
VPYYLFEGPQVDREELIKHITRRSGPEVVEYYIELHRCLLRLRKGQKVVVLPSEKRRGRDRKRDSFDK